MKTFRNNNNTFRSNNNRRHSFRRNDRGFQRNDSEQKFSSDFSSGASFKRGRPSRNNENASKLTEKYNDLAREALSHDDKILAENYFQHADHFVRVLNEKEVNRLSKIQENNSSEPKKLSEVLKNTKSEENRVIEPSKAD
ncbi:DUF4167 domain-containing protein [Candidatus Pelagibacter sp.]|nr:DUF4167 domain-containing protein [Candidatus Pelagibacter sp.]|tara:strand:+ start:1341 stop:1760 length:420 start_codon:yes stop_codon:yes gene_type:complete